MSAYPRAGQAMPNSDLIETCRELADVFAKRAAKYDLEGSFPVENFEDLKKAGLLGIMIPKEFGGIGADFLTYTYAIEQLARGDASTALTFNMHNIATGSLAELPTLNIGGSLANAMYRFRDWMFDEAIRNKRVFASASSEPGIGAHFSKIKTHYKRTGNGFVINGVKSFVSMAGFADYYVVAARTKDDQSDPPKISFLVVERSNPGARVKPTWDVLGMRATATHEVTFENCEVPESALFLASEGMALNKIAREPHWLVGGYVGVYLGICSAAFQFLTEFLKKKKQPGTETPVADDRVVQHEVGKIYAYLEAARAVTYNAARLVSERPGTTETNMAIHHAKYMVGELGPWLTSAAIRLCGASSITRRLPLERLYRDSRCGGLMPATSDECLGYLGKGAFGVDLRRPEQTYW